MLVNKSKRLRRLTRLAAASDLMGTWREGEWSEQPQPPQLVQRPIKGGARRKPAMETVAIPRPAKIVPPKITRANCPRGCVDRDLPAERMNADNLICLTCQTWTHDSEGWEIPGPRSSTADHAQRDWLRREALNAADEAGRAEAKEAEAARIAGQEPIENAAAELVARMKRRKRDAKRAARRRNAIARAISGPISLPQTQP
jgi:hypothetical protein